MDEELVLRNVRIQTLFCLDTGFLADRAALAEYNEWRTQEDWRDVVRQSLPAEPANGLLLRGVLESEYAKTDWGLYRSTLAEPPGQSFLPLDFGYAGESVSAGAMTGSLDRIFLSPRGALCLLHESRHADPAGWHSVVQVIRDHRRIYQLSRASVEAGLDAFARLWADSGLPGKLERPTATDWWPYVQIYELVDTDLGLRTGDQVTTPVEDIKRLYRTPGLAPGMDLVALTRMSEAAATDHKNTRVDELQTADIGYRRDELWAVTGERLVRCFPERDDWTEIAFFEDVMIAAAVLMLQRTARDSMALWAGSQRSAQYHQASAGTASKGSGTFADDIRKVLAASAVISEPSLLFIGTRNTFYSLVVAQLIRLLGVEERRKSALESVQQFAAFSETMANYRAQEAQLSLSQAAGRLGWISVLLAVVALVIGAVQIYIAVVAT
jgi:hypothetical protein